MAYDGSKFARLSSPGNNSIAAIYGYATNDPLATVLGADYFGEAIAQSNVQPMDVIFVRYDEDGTPGFVQLVVTSTTPGAVSVGQTAADGSVWITTQIATLGTPGSVYIAAPFAGSIRRFKSILGAAITDADETVTIELADVTVTGSTLTIAQSGSAAGDVDETTCTALNAVTAGQAVEIVTAGDCTGTICAFMVEFVPAVIVENTTWVCFNIASIGTAGSSYVAAPFAGTIRKWKTVLNGVTSFGSGDAALKLQLANVDVTGSAITISGTGEAVGDVDQATCTAANEVAAGDPVEIVYGGLSGTPTIPVFVMIEFVPA